MTFKELQQEFPGAKQSQWRIHKNGGGWVERTAHVDRTAYVGSSAIVYGYAAVYDDAQIYAGAKVCGDSVVDSRASISGEVIVRGQAKITGDATVTGNAIISDGRLEGHGFINGGEWNYSPLYIKGTMHGLTVSSYDTITIGCKTHSVEWWENHFKEVGQDEGYTADQIAEYGRHIKYAKAWMRSMGLHKKAQKENK